MEHTKIHTKNNVYIIPKETLTRALNGIISEQMVIENIFNLSTSTFCRYLMSFFIRQRTPLYVKRYECDLHVKKSDIEVVLKAFEERNSPLRKTQKKEKNWKRKGQYNCITSMYNEWFGKNSIKFLPPKNLLFNEKLFDEFIKFFFKTLERIYTKEEMEIIYLKFFKKNSILDIHIATNKPKNKITQILEKFKINDKIEFSILQLLLTGKSNLAKRYLLEQAKDIDEEFISMYYPKIQDYLDDNVIPTIIDLAVIS